MRCRTLFPLLFGLLALGACAESAAGPADVLPEDELTFLRLASTAPPLERDSVAFWAVAGEGRGVEIRFAPASSEDSEGEEFLRFEVPGDGLLRRPDGTAFQRGDSVRISVIVAEPRTLRFRFRPEGLTFRPDNPAELRISFARADDDYDGDGDQGDSEDQRIAQSFAVWHQTREGEPWTRIGTVREPEFERVRAQITSFSQYALAGGN